MTRLPRITGAELIAALAEAGFEVVHVKGSHRFLLHVDGRSTVVRAHAGEILGPGITAKILRDCDLRGTRHALVFLVAMRGERC